MAGKKRTLNKHIRKSGLLFWSTKPTLIFSVLLLAFLTITIFFAKGGFSSGLRSEIEESSVVGYSLVQDFKNDPGIEKIKKDAYNFLTLYITNGGNIYEVYDFIHNHPELDFLNQAETIYPNIFEEIRNRELPHYYSNDGLYAYLAYMETLEKGGYGGISIVGNLAFYYAKEAYYMRMITLDQNKGESLNYPHYSEEQIEYAASKGVVFAELSDKYIKEILGSQDPSENIRSFQTFLGMNDYAYSLRYLHSLSKNPNVKYSAADLFSFLHIFSKQGGTPDSYLFASLMDASSLLLEGADTSAIETALAPFFKIQPGASISVSTKVINAKYKQQGNRFQDLDSYSYHTVNTLAQKSPQFKSWLMMEGWSIGDFK